MHHGHAGAPARVSLLGARTLMAFCVTFGCLLATLGGVVAEDAVAGSSRYEALRDAYTQPAGTEKAVAGDADGEAPETTTASDPLMSRFIDWAALKSINPDTIGWIYVPNTPIDYPVVQAPAADPERYLHTTFTGEVAYPNNEGAIYLDAACAERGFSSVSPVLYGHEQLNGSMFSAWRDNGDAHHLEARRHVYIYTPAETFHVELFAANLVDASRERIRCDLERDEVDSWLEEKLAASEAILFQPKSVDQLWTFVTCSYTTWEDQRTLSYGVTVARRVHDGAAG